MEISGWEGEGKFHCADGKYSLDPALDLAGNNCSIQAHTFLHFCDCSGVSDGQLSGEGHNYPTSCH